jgi:hypothetical protein
MEVCKIWKVVFIKIINFRENQKHTKTPKLFFVLPISSFSAGILGLSQRQKVTEKFSSRDFTLRKFIAGVVLSTLRSPEACFAENNNTLSPSDKFPPNLLKFPVKTLLFQQNNFKTPHAHMHVNLLLLLYPFSKTQYIRRSTRKRGSQSEIFQNLIVTE